VSDNEKALHRPWPAKGFNKGDNWLPLCRRVRLALYGGILPANSISLHRHLQRRQLSFVQGAVHCRQIASGLRGEGVPAVHIPPLAHIAKHFLSQQ
jgi:hypothetical protein